MGLGQVYLNKGEPGRGYQNKDEAKKVPLKKTSPGRVHTNTMNESDHGESEMSSRGRSICKCGVAKRFGVKKIREGRRLWRNRMVKRWMTEHSPVAAAGKHQTLPEELEEDVEAALAEMQMEEELEDEGKEEDYRVGKK